TSRFLGHLRVELTATAEEQRSWTPWVRALIEAMVPASMQLSIRWRSPALPDMELSEDGIVLLPAPMPHLGTDAIAGYARLPPSGTPELSCGRQYALKPWREFMDTTATKRKRPKSSGVLAECCPDAECESGRRNRFFVGKRMTPDAFRVEQSYEIERRRLLN